MSPIAHRCPAFATPAAMTVTPLRCWVLPNTALHTAISFAVPLSSSFSPQRKAPAPGGAKYIVESGVLDDVEFMIGGHQSTYASVGQVLVKSGIACAGGHAFKLTLTGVGTHAISPQDGSDVISTAMQIIDSWQSMLSRQIDPQQPVVLSVCSIHAGEMGATNVLPSTAVFSGTIRTFNDPPAGKYPEKDAPACGIHFQIQRLYMHDGRRIPVPGSGQS